MKTLVNILLQIVGRVMTVLASSALVIGIGRYWGAESLGRYTSIVAFVGFFGFLAGQGLSSLITREVARDIKNSDRIVGQVVALAVILSLPTVVLVILLSSLVHLQIDRLVLILAIFAMLEGVWLSLFSGIFYGHERMDYEFVVIIVQGIATLCLALAAISFTHSLESLFLALLAARTAALFTAILLYRHAIGRGLVLQIRLVELARLLRRAAPFNINALLTLIYVQVDVLILAALRGTHEVGLYRGATTIVIQLPIIVVAMNNALLPRMSRSFADFSESLKTTLLESVRYGLILAIPITVGLFILARDLILFLFSDVFLPSVPILRLLVFVIPLRFISNTFGTALTATDRQHLRTRAVLVGGLVNIVVNLWLIRWQGYKGAAFATVVTDFTIFVLLGFHVRDHIRIGDLLRLLRAPLLAACAMSVYLFYSLTLHPLFLIPSAALIYFGLLYVIAASFRYRMNSIAAQLVGAVH